MNKVGEVLKPKITYISLLFPFQIHRKNQKKPFSQTSFLNKDGLTGGNWQKWKEYSWHVPAMKFIGMKQLV